LAPQKDPRSASLFGGGNQRRVLEWWVEKYGNLVSTVEFYFLSDDGVLEVFADHIVGQEY
jgi:hypothetical protein